MMPTDNSYRKKAGHISSRSLPARFLLSARSLLAGLSITGRFAFKPWRTVRYPFKVLDNLETYRGHIEHIGRADDPAVPRCISCMLCARACPSGCISLSPRKPEARENGADSGRPPRKDPQSFLLDFSKCSLCGLCVEACPVRSLRFSHDIYIVWTERGQFIIDLLARLQAQAARAQKEE